MNSIEKSIICGYGWQTDWYGSCGVVKDFIRGPFRNPCLVNSIPYVVMHCVCESNKTKCCGCGSSKRQYSCPPPCVCQPCNPVGCLPGHPFAGYRATNIGMGIPDPWATNMVCRPVLSKDEEKPDHEDELCLQNPDTANALVPKFCIAPTQGIPDPWLGWPKTCATIATMGTNRCPAHRPRPQPRPVRVEPKPRTGLCVSLRRFLRCRRGRSRAKRQQRKWFEHRSRSHKGKKCCCCCCCCCDGHRMPGAGHPWCYLHEEEGHHRRLLLEKEHPLNRLESFHEMKSITSASSSYSEKYVLSNSERIVQTKGPPNASEERLPSARGTQIVSKPSPVSESKSQPRNLSKQQSGALSKPQIRSLSGPQSKPQTQLQHKSQPKQQVGPGSKIHPKSPSLKPQGKTSAPAVKAAEKNIPRPQQQRPPKQHNTANDRSTERKSRG